MTDDVAQDRPARVASLLEANIRAELEAQDATADLGLSSAAIARLARGIVASG